MTDGDWKWARWWKPYAYHWWSGFGFEWSLRNERVIRRMSVVFAWKHDHLTTWKECLALFNRNSKEFLGRFVTMNEIWIYHNRLETKQQSKLCCYSEMGAEKNQGESVTQQSLRQFFGMHALQSTPIIFKRDEKSMVNIMPPKLWNRSMTIWRKIGRIWPKKKRF